MAARSDSQTTPKLKDVTRSGVKPRLWIPPQKKWICPQKKARDRRHAAVHDLVMARLAKAQRGCASRRRGCFPRLSNKGHLEKMTSSMALCESAARWPAWARKCVAALPWAVAEPKKRPLANS